MNGYKLQKSTEKNGNVRYHLTLSKELVEQLDWNKGDKIHQDLVIGGSGAGKIKLENIENEDDSK